MTLYCPSTELERAWATGNRRELAEVARRANVEVKWGRNSRYVMTALITKGTPPWRESTGGAGDEIVISGSIPDTVRDQHVVLTAKGYDVNNKVIPGLFFHWSVEPVYATGQPGVGRIELLNRDGSKVEFTNEIRRRDIVNQPWMRGDGACKVVCYALYNGVQRASETATIQLGF